MRYRAGCWGLSLRALATTTKNILLAKGRMGRAEQWFNACFESKSGVPPQIANSSELQIVVQQ
jgi:hypothetical protein